MSEKSIFRTPYKGACGVLKRGEYRKVIIVLGTLFLFVLFFAWMHSVPLDRSGGDVLIVLGYKSTDNKIHPLLKERLDSATELYFSAPFKKILLTGGAVGSERTEASLMADYLLEKGVPKDRILLEEKARDTIENLLFTKEIMASFGFTSCTVVSNSFHLRRVRYIAKILGFPIRLYTKRGWKTILRQMILTFNEIRIYVGTYNQLEKLRKAHRKGMSR